MNININPSNRLGSVSDDGVARLRSHPGLEHLLPHPGHGHLKAEDVTASSLRTFFSVGTEPSGEAQEPTTHLGLLPVDGLGQQRAGGGRGALWFNGLMVNASVSLLQIICPTYSTNTNTHTHQSAD